MRERLSIAEAGVADGAPRPPRALPWIGLAIGVLLLAAAGLVLYRNRDALWACWATARAQPAWMSIATLTLPLANWALTSAVFWMLTRRFGRVGFVEMSMLMGSAWLLNMLPFKPGLIGRIAYHRQISGIPIAASIGVTALAILTGGVGIVAALLAQVALDAGLRAAVPMSTLAPVAGGIAALALLPGIAIIAHNARRSRPVVAGLGAPLLASLVRFADTHVWALRYLIAFGLIGHGQPYGVCVVVACVSQIVAQAPVQFGLREWSVGVSAAALGKGAVGAAAAVPGLTVDLVCRAAEVACALPVGVVATAWVYRRIRAGRSAHHDATTRAPSSTEKRET